MTEPNRPLTAFGRAPTPAVAPTCRRALARTLSGVMLSASLAACGGGDPYPPLSMTIAHINDVHSNLDPASTAFELTVDGVATQAVLGGFARVAQAFKAYDGRQDVLKLHAGDALTGTLYYTLYKGAADAAMMNTVCFDAMAVGNHEFDDGDAALRSFIDALTTPTCQTPVLSANITPQVGTPLAPKASDDYIKPYTVKTIQGVDVGIVGLTVKGKTRNSSRPLASTDIADEALAAQSAIDALKAKGIRHIVLLTHLGYEADKALAAQLTDVDVIVGGDSHTLLGDFGALGLPATAGDYPTRAVNKDGDMVCIGQAWEYAKAIGDMQVRFDAQGRLTACSGQASLIVGEPFKRKDGAGNWVSTDATTTATIKTALAAVPAAKVLSDDAQAASTLKTYSDEVNARKATRIATLTEDLCLVRVPGESTNRSTGIDGCADANTRSRGSDAAQVVAEAFLDGSLAADLAIQNAGGVRIAVPAGEITLNTAFTLLPFTNVLVELKMTGAQIAMVLEDAVANHLDNAGSTGSHPYAAGLRWDLDMSKPRGSRFANLEVRDRATGVWQAIEPGRTYTVATNDYIASGKDGYTTFGAVFERGDYVNNYLLYTQTFVDYVTRRATLGRPAAADYAHKSVITASGVTLP